MPHGGGGRGGEGDRKEELRKPRPKASHSETSGKLCDPGQVTLPFWISLPHLLLPMWEAHTKLLRTCEQCRNNNHYVTDQSVSLRSGPVTEPVSLQRLKNQY